MSTNRPANHSPVTTRGRVPGRLGLTTALVLLVALAALVPTVGDFGLTWDEPAYRYSQVLSVQWWEQLARVRSWRDAEEVFDPLTLLYYWPYGRYGINFHPPLAGQLNLAAHALFGHWMKDIPARRMASVIEFALTITIGFHFLARRYGLWVGLVMAGSLLLDAAALRSGPPDRYRHAGPFALGGDRAGILERAARARRSAMAGRRRHPAWPGVHREDGRGHGAPSAALVADRGSVAPIVHAHGRLGSPGSTALLTTGAMLAPLALAFQQIQMLQQRLPPPNRTDLFVHRPTSDWPGAILAIPLAVWFVRRLLGRLFPAARSGESSGRRSRPGRRSWRSPL